MKPIELLTRIEAPPERVFDIVADHEGMVRWSGAREVVLRHPGYPAPNGVGATRVVRMRGLAIEEEIVSYDPPKRIEYRLVAGLPVRDYVGEVSIEPDGAGSRLTWRVRFHPRIPGTAWILRPLIHRAITDLVAGLTRFCRS